MWKKKKLMDLTRAGPFWLMFRAGLDKEIFRQELKGIAAFRCYEEKEEPEKNQAVANCYRNTKR